MNLNSYPKIYNLGHKAISDLLKDSVVVEEKIDGSQFSFGVIDGELEMRSKGAQLFPPVKDNLFKAATEYVQDIKDSLTPGWTYRGEVLYREKHNALLYGRVPRNNIAIFDIDTGDQNFLGPKDKEKEAKRLKLDIATVFHTGLMITDLNQVKGLLDQYSGLSTQVHKVKLEGIVIKNYNRFGRDGKVLMGKWVREEFKEVQRKDWKKGNLQGKDIIQNLIAMYRTEARWDKALQHLRESGKLEGSPRDIGILLAEIQRDTKHECEDEIKDYLMKWAWKKIGRGITAGFPEYYKDKLAEAQFETTKEDQEKPQSVVD